MPMTDEEVLRQYNEKVLATGSFIDYDFLEDVLSKSKNEEIQVLDFNVKAAVGAGDNYLGILYKTRVTYKSQGSDEETTCSLMVKGVPTSKIVLEMIEEMGVFRKEILMYTECLPLIHAKLKEHFPEGTPYVTPDSYKCNRENTLVMEDLTEDGYKMANRRDQLDYDHCSVTLRTLARFHALSCKVIAEDPDLIERIATEFYTSNNQEKMAPLLTVCFPLLAGEIEKWAANARFAPIVLEAGKNIWEKLMVMVQPSGNFNVLNHGDLWVNNIMYKYDEDETVVNAKLIDFQLARYSTPALDLHYFFFTSPQPSVLKENIHEFLEIYHSALITNLLALDLDINYSLEELYDDLKNRATFGLLAMTQILPLVVAPPSGTLDFDNLEEEVPDTAEHPLLKNFKNELYQEVASSYLEIMEMMGYLDIIVNKENTIESVLELDNGLVGEDLEDYQNARASTARAESANERPMLARWWKALTQPICD